MPTQPRHSTPPLAATYPLQLTFKIVAIAPQLSVTDADGRLLYYVRQKAFRLKEAVTVFADQEQARPLYSIAADRIIDFSARYDITAADGRVVGAVQREGMRSLWRAHYEVLRAGGAHPMSIREEKAWVKLVDGLVGEIPIVGMFSGYFLHPAYVVARDGVAVLRVRKLPALFEGRYEIARLAPLDAADEEAALLGVLMMVLLERTRG